MRGESVSGWLKDESGLIDIVFSAAVPGVETLVAKETLQGPILYARRWKAGNAHDSKHVSVLLSCATLFYYSRTYPTGVV